MSGKKSKILRRKIYGNDYSSKYRKYFIIKKTGQIVCDEKRRKHQTLKTKK